MIQDTNKLLSEIVTLKDYDYLLKTLYRETLEEIRLFIINESDYFKINYIEMPVFQKVIHLKGKTKTEIIQKDLHFPCNNFYESVEDYKVLDEETIFKNIMSFYGAKAFYQTKYFREPYKMWYHIILSLPVGPHYCPFYLNEKLPNVCRGTACNSISNVCNHPKGKSLEMNFWIKELKELAGLLYREGYIDHEIR